MWKLANRDRSCNSRIETLQRTTVKNLLLAGTHYYLFGTEMAGISSHSPPSYVPNRYKANGGADCVPRAIANREYGDGEWSNNTGLEMYETFYRSYNAQTGRFMQGDPMMEATITMGGYVFSGNNPAMFSDLLGDQKDPGHYGYWPQPFYFRSNFFSYMDKNGNKWHHTDFMAGTGAEGIPYTEGWGMDGFGDMTTGGGGSYVSKIMWSTNGGVQGYKIMWRINGESGEGNTLDEIKFAMTFKPFSSPQRLP